MLYKHCVLACAHSGFVCEGWEYCCAIALVNVDNVNPKVKKMGKNLNFIALLFLVCIYILCFCLFYEAFLREVFMRILCITFQKNNTKFISKWIFLFNCLISIICTKNNNYVYILQILCVFYLFLFYNFENRYCC